MSTSIYQDTLDNVIDDLPSEVESLYTSILEKNPTLVLYVIGYPYLTPEIAPANITCWPFNEAANNPDPTTGDSAAAYSLVSSINNVLRYRVMFLQQYYGNRIRYVDPNNTTGSFTGHDWCAATPYFTEVAINSQEYSYHPNTQGHQAYATEVKLYLQNN